MLQVTARVTALAVLTDQAVAAVLSPALLLWETEPGAGDSRAGRYLDMAAREWNLAFKEIVNNSLSGEYVQLIFHFLQGQHQTLSKLAGQKVASNFSYHLNRSEMCDRFFGKFFISKTLDGRQNKFFLEHGPGPSVRSPFSLHKKSPNKSPFVKSKPRNLSSLPSSFSDRSSLCPVNTSSEDFGPSQGDFEPDSTILPLHEFIIGTYSIGSPGNKPICKVRNQLMEIFFNISIHCLGWE